MSEMKRLSAKERKALMAEIAKAKAFINDAIERGVDGDFDMVARIEAAEGTIDAYNGLLEEG